MSIPPSSTTFLFTLSKKKKKTYSLWFSKPNNNNPEKTTEIRIRRTIIRQVSRASSPARVGSQFTKKTRRKALFSVLVEDERTSNDICVLQCTMVKSLKQMEGEE
ncbi:uncharacterized protein DS421_3g63520 [Arachis hypogaea]|nr:uncharacterized protein DS421_3g63520 [Arachis hypogaea]